MPRPMHAYRTARFLVATVLLAVIVTLPFTLSSIWEEMTTPPEGPVFRLPPPANAPEQPVSSRLHLATVAFDDLTRLVSLRITGQHTCVGACPWTSRMVLFSLDEDELETEGLPYNVTVAMPDTSGPVLQTVQLPMRGSPIRYPFDRYELWLGVTFEHASSNGTVVRLAPGQEAGYWYLTFQEKLPRLVLTSNDPANIAALETVDNQRTGLHYGFVQRFGFERPIYLRVLTVLLVLLVSAAACYAVFMRPLQDLVVNSGALVLGVWGIRGIISSGNQAFVSAVDLSLALVILFLLGAITVRALQFFHARTRPAPPADADEPPPADAAGPPPATTTPAGEPPAPATSGVGTRGSS